MLSIYDQIAISERAAPIPFPFRPYSPPIKITNNYTYIVYINKEVNVQ